MILESPCLSYFTQRAQSSAFFPVARLGILSYWFMVEKYHIMVYMPPVVDIHSSALLQLA